MQGERDQPDQTGRKQNPQPGGGQLPPQHHEPQKCPRCDSHNTKFCYYNNYSLSQPRYFCKACRRYWTHGGTLRNVPVGGGCRKGKRAKTMSSSSSASATNSARSIVQPQQDHQLQQHRSLMMSAGQTALGSLVGGSQYYSGSTGYTASLPYAQSLNNLGRAYHLGLGSSSNLSLMQGFNAMSSYGQRQMPTQFFKSNMEPPPMYIYNDHGAMLLQPTRPTSIMADWGESFINKSHASASVGTISTGQSPTWSTTNTNTTNVGHGGGFSLNKTLWPNDLAGFYVNGPPQ